MVRPQKPPTHKSHKARLGKKSPPLPKPWLNMKETWARQLRYVFPLSCRPVERPNHVQSNPSRRVVCRDPMTIIETQNVSIPSPSPQTNIKRHLHMVTCLKESIKRPNISSFPVWRFEFTWFTVLDYQTWNAPGISLGFPQFPGPTSIDRLETPPWPCHDPLVIFGSHEDDFGI
jgi:hypothetical protein